MAIRESFTEWRHYLAHSQTPVEVITDHLNHKYLMDKQKVSSRQIRWLEELAEFNFKITWREGPKNPADGLSRKPQHEGEDIEGTALNQDLLRVFTARFAAVRTRQATSRGPREDPADAEADAQEDDQGAPSLMEDWTR